MSPSNALNEDAESSGAAHTAGPLRNFIVNELLKYYCSEKTLLKILPKIVKEVHARLLFQAISHHVKQTESAVLRLEKLLANLKIQLMEDRRCETMSGLIKDAGRMIENAEDPVIRDLGIISSLLKVGVFQMSIVQVIIPVAAISDQNNLKKVLLEIHDEKNKANNLLSQLLEFLLKSRNSGTNLSK